MAYRNSKLQESKMLIESRLHTCPIKQFCKFSRFLDMLLAGDGLLPEARDQHPTGDLLSSKG